MRHSRIQTFIIELVLAGVLCIATGTPARAEENNPFASLVGKWRGSGLMELSRNRKQRMTCDALYSGGAAQLVLSIKCKGDIDQVDMGAKLSSNNGRLLGFWEEKIFKVAGSIAGTANKSKLNFKIIGPVTGTMEVAYSKTKQQVIITARGISLEKLTMSMTRR